MPEHARGDEKLRAEVSALELRDQVAAAHKARTVMAWPKKSLRIGITVMERPGNRSPPWRQGGLAAGRQHAGGDGDRTARGRSPQGQRLREFVFQQGRHAHAVFQLRNPP